MHIILQSINSIYNLNSLFNVFLLCVREITYLFGCLENISELISSYILKTKYPVNVY